MRTVPLLALALLPACSVPRIPPGTWQTLAVEQGVVVSARGVADRRLPVFRGVGHIPASIFEVQAVLTDVPRQTEWMSHCGESRVVRSAGNVRWVYNRTVMPAPVRLLVWDRDVVVKVETRIEEGGRVFESRFEQADSALVPVAGRVVRSPRLTGHYRLTAVTGDRTRVEYLVDADPGGELPDWVKQRGARELPLRTILGLRRQVERTRGEYTLAAEHWRDRAGPGG